jgi:hypothetical protein
LPFQRCKREADGTDYQLGRETVGAEGEDLAGRLDKRHLTSFMDVALHVGVLEGDLSQRLRVDR